MQRFPLDAEIEVAPRLLIVGDDPLVRATFADRLSTIVVGQVASAGDVGAELERSGANVALWDLGPDLERAENRMTSLVVPTSEVPAVWLVPTGFDGVSALAAGSQGVLGRDSTATAIRAAVDSVLHGFVVIDPEHAATLVTRERQVDTTASELTPREREVLELVAAGCSNRQIGEALHISPHTVKFHVNAILDKLDAQTRTEAVVKALQLGYVML